MNLWNSSASKRWSATGTDNAGPLPPSIQNALLDLFLLAKGDFGDAKIPHTTQGHGPQRAKLGLLGGALLRKCLANYPLNNLH
jgi:hypothetical protein